MNIGITGSHGRLGSQLIQMGCIPLECDVTNPEDIKHELAQKDVDAIINCAAVTSVDGIEKDKECYNKALKVNFRGIDNLKKCFEGRIIQISTDYIFDGKHGPYTEKYRQFEPIDDYGYTKLAGEIAFSYPHREQDTVVRTTGLYGGCSGRHDFFQLVYNRLSSHQHLVVTRELQGNQTYVPHLAEALIYIANLKEVPPIIHVGSTDVISRFDFAIMIANVFSLDKSLLDYGKNREIPGWIAERPKKGGLKTSLAKKLGVPLYSVLDGLKAMKEEMNGSLA